MSVDSALKHIAIIMDGNNRWAKKRRLIHINGHKAGVERIRDMLTVCKDHGVECLTLFAFSSENWSRPAHEVTALMNLFHTYLKKESPRLREEGVRLRVIGGRERFSAKILDAIDEAEALTAEGDRNLVIAADYGGRWDIVEAAKKIARQVSENAIAIDDITETTLDNQLTTHDLPPVDLLIRTGGELRISNFLLWQAAYAELYFSEELWPDFSDTHLLEAMTAFKQRQRRFGLTAEQIQGQSGA